MERRFAIGLLTLMMTIFAAGYASAERITVRAGAHPGYGRIVFKWSLPVTYNARIDGNQLVVSFGEPAETSYNEVQRNLRKFVTGARSANGGRTVTFPLTSSDYQVRSFYSGSYLVVDILGQPPAVQAAPKATPRPAPAPVASAPSVVPGEGPSIRVRKGEHPTYTRVVFDWTRKVPYQVGDYQGKTVITFDEPAKYNLSAATRGLNGQVRGIRQNGNAVELNVTSGSRIKHFYAGTKVVVDVYRDQMAQKPAAPTSVTPTEVAKAAEPAAAPAPKPAPVMPTPVTAPEPPAPKAAPVTKVEGPLEVPAPAPTMVSEMQEQTGPNASGLAAAFSLRFEFGEPVGAAAFRRGSSVWLVFDKQTNQDLTALKDIAKGGILDIEQLDIARATVLRLETVPGFNPRPKREGLTWIFDFGRLPLLATQEIEIEPQPFSPAGARLFMPVQEGGLPVPFRDPIVGDNLVVVPVIPLGHGVNAPRHYPQFDILASSQGVAYRPISDDLRVRTLKSGIEMTAASSLKLSDTGQKAQAAAKVGGLRGISRMFDFDKWKAGSMEDYRENRQQFENAVAGLTGPRRDIARMNLARYYVSHAMGPEALGVLNVMMKADQERATDPEFMGLHGIANFVLNRLDEAADDFATGGMASKNEGEFWQAAVKAAQGNMDEAAPELKRLAGVIRPYPPRLKFPLGLLLTEAALSIGDVRQAESYLEVLEAENLNPRQIDAVKYLRAKAKEISGDPDGAVVIYEEVENGNHRPSRAKALLAKAELLHKHERITDEELIESLEKLRFAWRGDDFEFNLLRRLGDMYVKTKNYRDGLRTLRQAATYFRQHPDAEAVTEEMIRIFEELYLAGKADELPPVTAIALYDEFRELTPAGAKGDEMIRKLADRLAAVDLLREAAELLENQVQFRLSGEQKSQVGTRLAVVYLAANKPNRAIRALKKSARADMSVEEVIQRRHLEARALIDMGQADKALAMLSDADDETLDADMLRSEVYWNAGDWRNAGIVLKRIALAKGAQRGKPLNEEQANLVLNLAVAYTLGANERGVGRIRTDYGAAMEETALRDAFRLIATSENAGMLDPRTITQLVKPAEKFTSFMAQYKERLKAGELSTIN